MKFEDVEIGEWYVLCGTGEFFRVEKTIGEQIFGKIVFRPSCLHNWELPSAKFLRPVGDGERQALAKLVDKIARIAAIESEE